MESSDVEKKSQESNTNSGTGVKNDDLLGKTALGFIYSNIMSSSVLLENAVGIFNSINAELITFTDINHLNEALSSIESSIKDLNESVEKKLCEIEQMHIESEKESE